MLPRVGGISEGCSHGPTGPVPLLHRDISSASWRSAEYWTRELEKARLELKKWHAERKAAIIEIACLTLQL